MPVSFCEHYMVRYFWRQRNELIFDATIFDVSAMRLIFTEINLCEFNLAWINFCRFRVFEQIHEKLCPQSSYFFPICEN